MKLLLLACLTLVFVSCSQETKQVTADITTKALSKAIVVSLDCAKTDVVTADVQAKMYEWFKIQEQNKSIGGDLCKLAIGAVVPQLIGIAVPTTWECKNKALNDAANVLAESACKNL